MVRLSGWVFGTVTTAALLASTAGVSLAASSNLVANPSGAGGSTTGWSAAYNGQGATIQAVTQNGISWLHYKSTQQESGGDWVQFSLSNVTQGQTYTCGFMAKGTGTIYADAYDGSKDNTSTPTALTSTPQPFLVTFTVASTGNNPFQVRYNTPPVDVYFNEATCVPGKTLTLAAETPAATSGSSPASGASSGSTSSGSTSSGTSLPKTGGSPLLPAAGAGLVLAGAGLLSLRRRRAG